jgi:hypothetical protein
MTQQEQQEQQESPCLMALSQTLFRDVLYKHARGKAPMLRQRGLFIAAFASFSGDVNLRMAARFVTVEKMDAGQDPDVVAILKVLPTLRQLVAEGMNPSEEFVFAAFTATELRGDSMEMGQLQTGRMTFDQLDAFDREMREVIESS